MARQFDVFRHPLPSRRSAFPYLVVLQHDGVAYRTDVVVAPLVPPDLALPSRLYPIFELQGSALMLLKPAMATIDKNRLRHPVSNLEVKRREIITALDMLFVGS